MFSRQTISNISVFTILFALLVSTAGGAYAGTVGGETSSILYVGYSSPGTLFSVGPGASPTPTPSPTPGPGPTPTPGFLPGDLNHDGAVNADDLALLTASFNKSGGDAGFNPGADLNGDGIVDVFDLVRLGFNFGKTG